MGADLSRFGGGALQAQFDREFDKALKNIKDKNTPYKAARKVTITMTLQTDEDREKIRVSCNVSSTLAKAKTFETHFAVGQDLKTGAIIAKEYGTQIPGQMGLDDFMPAAGAEEQDKVKKFEDRKLSPAIGG